MSKIYLDANDELTITGAKNPVDVFGQAGGLEAVFIGSNNDNAVTVNQSVEQVLLSGATTSYTYVQQGGSIKVMSGTTLVTTVFAQTDTNGTQLTFSNGTVDVKFGTGADANTLFFGGVKVDATTPTTITPLAIDSANTSTGVPGGGASSVFNLTASIDTYLGTTGNDIINANPIAAGVELQATTLNSFDTIDGGAGTDTLNIVVGDTAQGSGDFANAMQQGTIKNVEIINITNNSAAPVYSDNGWWTDLDAAQFEGATEINQKIRAADQLSNLASTTKAVFTGAMIGAGLNIQTRADATSANIDFNGVDETASLAVYTGAADAVLNTVNISGTRKDGIADANTTVTAMNAWIQVGTDVQTLTLKTATDVVLTAASNPGVGAKVITSLNASESTGGVAYTSAANTVTSIKTGSGKDTVTINTLTVKDNVATVADETVNALVETGAGNDTVVSTALGTGLTTITTGDGDDTVTITTKSDKIAVSMGAGKDSFTSAVAITVNDSVDAGEGIDTLALKLVGLSNVGVFKNFDVFDVVGMTAPLDLNILNTNNTVTEIVGSGALAAPATLQNLASGVNFRATGDMGLADALTLSQTVAGPLTVTLDADETGTADLAADAANTSVVTTNATTVSAVFDTSYLASIPGEAAVDNLSVINLSNAAATSVSVVSGGALSVNTLNLVDAKLVAGALASVTVTGTQSLTLNVAFASTDVLTSIDSSASTGGLITSLAFLKDGGAIKLGTGVDAITVTSASTTGAMESISGIEKAAAAAIGTDAAAKATAIADADMIISATSIVASASVVAGGEISAKGILTFTGAGPATLADAIGIANLAAETAGEATVFQYLTDSYFFVQGATDTVVKLVGTTGITNLVENVATDNFFVV